MAIPDRANCTISALRETVEATLREVVRCTKEQIRINTFGLGADNVFNTHPDKASAALNNDNNGTFPYSVFSPFGFNGAYVYGKVAYRW